MPNLLAATAEESKVESSWRVSKIVKSAKLLAATLALLTLTAVTSQSQTSLGRESSMHRITLSVKTGWQFREVGKEAWHPATVPGCVHTDLLNNKLIEDPFYRDNEQKQQWIGKTDWEYQTTINVTPELLKHDRIDLVFEGLDTYANVFLNDSSLLDTDNMFRTWRVDCKSLLKAGANTLRIRFRSPINEVLLVSAMGRTSLIGERKRMRKVLAPALSRLLQSTRQVRNMLSVSSNEESLRNTLA